VSYGFALTRPLIFWHSQIQFPLYAPQTIRRELQVKSKPSRQKSLSITRPWGRTALMAVLILGILLITIEGLFHLDGIQRRFQLTSYGNYHYLFEVKWFQLERYVEEHGGVDVIFLGSSLVNSGIVPEKFTAAYTKKTGGETLRAFNFGIEGMTIQPNSVVAKILIESYQPQALIFGTEIRDYYSKNGVVVAERFLSNDWVRYRNGDFNLGGWLAEHSEAYPYYLAYRNWLTWKYYENFTTIMGRIDKMMPDGYDIEHAVNTFHTQPPDPNNAEDKEAIDFFADYEIDESRLDNLQDLLDLGETYGVEIIFIEMPVAPTFFGYFERGEDAHAEFVEVVSEVVEESGNIFIPAPLENLFPEKGRSDRVHLNKYGAPIFSRFLGEQLGEMHLQEGFSFTYEGGTD
jgi:hypothetical protein